MKNIVILAIMVASPAPFTCISGKSTILHKNDYDSKNNGKIITTDSPEKAFRKINSITEPNFERLVKIINNPAHIYNITIDGTNLDATLPIFRMPPNTILAMIIEIKIPTNKSP